MGKSGKRAKEARARRRAAKKAESKKNQPPKKPQERRDNNREAAPPHREHAPQSQDAEPQSWLRFFFHWAIFLGAPGLALTAILAIPSFLPRVDIASSPSPDSKSPFFASFSATNNGLLGIYGVRLSCRLNEIFAANKPRISDLGITTPHLATSRLDPADSFEFECPFTKVFKIEDPISSADIDIIISFRPAFSFFKTARCAHFIAEPNETGTIRWIKRPTEICSEPLSMLTYTGS